MKRGKQKIATFPDLTLGRSENVTYAGFSTAADRLLKSSAVSQSYAGILRCGEAEAEEKSLLNSSKWSCRWRTTRETGGSRETRNELFIVRGWLAYRLRVFADRGLVIFNGIERSFVTASQIADQDPRIGVKLKSRRFGRQKIIGRGED